MSDTNEPEIGETVGATFSISEVAAAFAGDEVTLAFLEVYGQLYPGEAIDIAIIISIITTIAQFIQQCRDSRGQQRQAVNRRSRRARVTAFRAVRQEFPDKSRREQWRLAEALLEKAIEKPQVLEQLQDDAYSMGPGLIAI